MDVKFHIHSKPAEHK